ncbi:MAG: DUF2344 domain-containing protein [Geodermatophilaceae bacterium]|nr:DUF2344 domain-containing protein [Geodermatophilaceae bacterium]
MQRLRLRYTKRDRLRFTSHRDFARAFERAIRRAGLPMAYSAGFSPHPKISYLGAAPTGVASEAEYLEIGLAIRCDPETVRADLDASLPPGLDVVECVEASGEALAQRIEASLWRVALPGVDDATLTAAVAEFLGRAEVMVERMAKNGKRPVDARAAVVRAVVVQALAVQASVVAGSVDQRTAPTQPGAGSAAAAGQQPCAILELGVRQVTPAVRPDDVIAALAAVAGCAAASPPRSMRVAQGRLDESGQLTDPLAPDRAEALAAREGAPAAVAGAPR